jgi:pyruvate decarboxylase
VFSPKIDRKWTSLLSVFGSTNGKSYRVKTKKELSALLDDEEFASAKVIQLVEILMDPFDAPEMLKKEVDLSKMAS